MSAGLDGEERKKEDGDVEMVVDVVVKKEEEEGEGVGAIKSE